MQRKCLACNKPFSEKQKKLTQKYCSKECYFNIHRIKRVCPQCGKTTVAQKRFPRKDFCSQDCWNVFKRKRPMLPCRLCGNLFKEVSGKANNYCSKPCADKGKTLPREEFARRCRARLKAYRALNREKTAAWKQKRRALEAGAEGHFTDKQWGELKEKHEQKCAICKETKKLTVDHIIPLSKGGSNYIENIQPLCLSCNSRKWAKI